MQPKTDNIVFDSARLDIEILNAKKLNPNFDSLYRGQSEENLSSVAPYLFTTEKDSEFSNWYFSKGWGDSWGVLVYSSEELKNLVKHFRKFLLVKTEAGDELYFRFYDPRVLRIFLPTCDQQQLKEFFGPVDAFICEDEDAGYGLVFSLQDGILKTQRLTKEEVIAFEPLQKKKKFSFF